MKLAVQKAPYNRTEPGIRTIRKIHEVGLPDPIIPATLERIGVNPHNAYQTIQMLRFLGIIDEKGHHTETYERLRRATTSDYGAVLAEIIRAAYHPVFAITNPAEDDMVAISDAFKNYYEPAAQRQRMVTLFLALCAEGGITVNAEKPRRDPQPRRVHPRTRGTKPTDRKTQASKSDADDTSGTGNMDNQAPRQESRQESEDVAPDYRVLALMLQHLPKDGQWTQVRRDKWVNMMTAAVDGLVEVVSE
jgi:hypothetical protein